MKLVATRFEISSGFDRLFFFIVIFFILCHTVACLFVIIAGIYDENYKDTWIEDYIKKDSGNSLGDLYAITFYWTITTITTVGYGDISATNTLERWFCSAIMIVGVISFSFANGSLSLIIS